MAGEYISGLTKLTGGYDKMQKQRAKLAADPRVSRGQVNLHLGSRPISESTWRKSAQRQIQRNQERKTAKAVKKRSDRMIQLAKMPKGRGASEYKRLAEGGSIIETPTEKKARQRKAQLAEMPNGRGKVDHESMMKKAVRQEKTAAARRKANANAYEQGAGKKPKAEATNPVTQTQGGGAGKKSPGLSDTKANEQAKAQRAAAQAKAKAAQAKAKAEAAARKAAAEAKKKAAMAAKIAAITGKKK